MFRTLWPLALVALFVFGSSGCTTTTVERAGVAVSLVDLSVGNDNRAVLVLRLQNENIVPIAVTSTKHKVKLNGIGYGEAVGEKPVALMQHGDVRHEVVLALSGADAERLRASLAAGPVDYELSSRFFCEEGEDELILKAVASGRCAGR